MRIGRTIVGLGAIAAAIGSLLGAAYGSYTFIISHIPKTEWVDAHGESCLEACALEKLSAARLGKSPKNESFHLCSAKLTLTGAAFNGGVQPGERKQCFVQGALGGSDTTAPTEYRCLCTNPPLGPPS
jgi:hypothetical protein